MATSSKRAGGATPTARPRAPAPPRHDVRGLILDLGEALPAPARRKAIATLRAEVPAFAALTSPDATARPLGKGAGDVFVPLAAGIRVDIARAWDAVHALHAHRLVADCEPAVGYRLPPHPVPGAVRASGRGEAHLPGSAPRDWSAAAVRADAARARFAVDGRGVRVGHPDTGYSAHPGIAGPRLRIGEGYDYVADAPDPRDPLGGRFPGHGTATASVIAGVGPPDLFGIAPGAEVVPLRVSDSVVHFDFGHLVQALYRARDRGCHVVSMSLGGPWAGRSLSRAADALVESGMVLLAAAGNHTGMVVFPALLENVVAVAASNADGRPWRGSASGAAVDITAPGESVWRAHAWLDERAPVFAIERSSGTSYATATTAGVCALWLQRHGVEALRARYGARLASVFTTLLKAHCRPLPDWDGARYGPGLVDAAALLAAPLPALGGAMVRSARPAPSRTSAAGDWARLQPYLPELTPAQLARAATALYGAGVRPGTAARRSALLAPPPSLIDEVAFHLATDPAMRQAVLAAAGVAPVPVPAPRTRRAAVAVDTAGDGPAIDDAAPATAADARTDARALLRARASVALRGALDP